MHWILMLISLPFILINSQTTSNEPNSLAVLCQPICLNSMNTMNSAASSNLDKANNENKEPSKIKDKPLEKLIVVSDNDKDIGQSGEVIKRLNVGLNDKSKMTLTSEKLVESIKSSPRDNQLVWNSNRWAKLPIRPPKLRFGSKPIATKSRRIAYGSMIKTRSLSKDDVNRDLIPLAYTNSSQIGGHHDILELSSSEKRTSRMRIGHQFYRNSPEISSSDETSIAGLENDRLNGQKRSQLLPLSSFQLSRNGEIRSANSNYRNIPKLLLPKFSRPAMYSLNGFIPKPNIQRLTTSTTSTTVKPSLINRLNRKESARTYNLDKNNQRKAQFKHSQGLENSDDLKISGSVNRLSKRRGYLSTLKGRNTNSPNEQSKYKVAGRRGQPGKDYPIINAIPKTSFDCKDHIGGSGFYADAETGCQVWHMCQGHRKHSFLCPNGTIFNQKSGVCDWWYNVDCTEVPSTTLLGTSETTFRTSKSSSTSLFESLLMDRRSFFR